MSWITVTTPHGNPCYVSADHIIAVIQANPTATTCTIMLSGGEKIEAKETADVVLKAIQGKR